MRRVRPSLADNIAIILLNEFLEPFWVALLQGFHNVLTKHAWDFIRFLIRQLKVAHTGTCCPCLLLIDVGLRHKLGHRKPTGLAQHRHRHAHHLTTLRHILHGLLHAVLGIPQALQSFLLRWQSLLAPLSLQGALRLTHKGEGFLQLLAQVRPAGKASMAGDVASPAVMSAYHCGHRPGVARVRPIGHAGWGSAWLVGPAANRPAPVAPPAHAAARALSAAAACDQAGLRRSARWRIQAS